MIFTESTIKISNNVSKMDSTIVLYRGDKNVEIRFTILQSPFKYSNTVATNVIESTNASYGQLVIKTPNSKPPIFSEVSATKEGTVLFTITKEMIDEIEEVGVYTFQIRLMDENKQSRVTIPPVENGIEIKEPIAIEDDNTTNVVGLAKANYAVATLSDVDTPTFDNNGKYNKTNWNDGDIITNASLNKIEDGIYTTNENVNTKYKDIVNRIENGNIGNKVEPQNSDIPRVFFNGEKPTSKAAVHATIEYKSKTEHFKGYVEIKCQGTSSMAYPKKNYTIKMFTDSTMAKKVKKDFKGWGAQSKFCLKANYIDHSHARNICSARLWNQIVASRANYALLPELLRTSPCNGAIDGFPIKVYYNNNYEGVYTWNIPKDKWMFNMDDTLDNHCVLCGEEYNSGCFLSANASLWSDEIHDTMPANIVTSFNAFQNFVINSSDDEFKANLENYVYVDSLIDYYIFQYVICGLDSMGKNQLFATYNGTKWIATSYDMDSTFGIYWNGQSFVSPTYRMQQDYESGKNGNANKLYVRLEKLFINEIKARYSQLRADILSYNNIVNTFEPFMDTIGNDLYAEDLTIYTAIPSGSTNNIRQIRNYYRDRVAYVDTQINKLVSAIACTNITLNKTTLQIDSSTTSNEPKNYLKDVPSAMNGSDLTFNQITIEKGFYKFTNINGGTFQFLNCYLNGKEYIPNKDTTDPLYVHGTSDTNTLVVHGYPHNDANNTADKLALYKLIYTQVQGTQPITFTQAGTGYFSRANGTLMPSDNDVYSNEVALDSSKLYALKYNGEQQKSSYYLCIKVNSTMQVQIDKIINKGDIVCAFTNATSFQFSTNVKNSGTLADYTLIEVTEDYEKDTISSAKLIPTVTPTETTDKVVWSVSPTGIVAVEDGVITPISNGTCIVTATCGSHSATCNVTVNLPVQAVTALNLDKDSITLGNSAEVDTSNVNLLDGVNHTIATNNNIVFNSITLDSGIYIFKNINGGSFTWLGANYNGTNFEIGNVSEDAIFKFDNRTAVQFHAFPDNKATNTADKLGLYKIATTLTNPIKFTLAGHGYYNNGNFVEDDNNVYSTAVNLDASKKYVLMNEGANQINQGYCTWKIDNGSGDKNVIKVLANSPIKVFENVTSLSISINTVNNTLADLTLYEPSSASTKFEDALTATLTPANATNKNVTWTANNENVTLVPNGLKCTVKAKAVGDSIVTCTSQDATNGTIADTCNVTVSAIPATPTALYTLPQETTFNGTSDYVDTGIQLFKTDQDFTITIDVTADTITSAQSCLIHCMKEASPYPGIVLQTNAGTDYFVLSKGNNVSPINNLVPPSQRTKVVIVKNGTTMKVYNSNNVTGESQYRFTTIDQTLLLGAYQTTDGVKGRFFKGTIHEFSISNTVYTNEQINAYLGISVATD